MPTGLILNAEKRTLWSMRAGEKCRLEAFDASLAESYRIRMMELGFHPGEVVTCVRAPVLNAPKVYRVSNTMFSLDDEVAAHISVSMLNSSTQ